MNRKAAFVMFFAILFVLASSGLAPRPVSAQFPMFFGATRFPAIEVDGSDRLYLAMSVATAPASEHRPHSQIFFTTSKDGGHTWDNLPQTRNLTNSPGEAFGPSLVVSKEGPLRLYIAYHDNSTGTYEAYLLSTKKKTKFRKPQNLTPSSGATFSPRLGMDSAGNVNLVYGDTTGGGRRVRFMRSTDQGATFSEPLQRTSPPGTSVSTPLALAYQNVVYVGYQNEAPRRMQVYLRKSEDGGVTFADAVQISNADNNCGRAHSAAMTVDSQGTL